MKINELFVKSDPQVIVAGMIVEYFNQIGRMLIDSKKSGVRLTPKDVCLIYTRDIRRLGKASSFFSGSTIKGTELEIYKELFLSNEEIKYSQYFQKIYKELRKNIIPSFIENTKSFRDLYEYIQNIVVPKDEAIHHVLSRYSALYVHSDKKNVTVCIRNGNSDWFPLVHFEFIPEQNAVIINTITNGKVDNENGLRVFMNVAINQLKATGDTKHVSMTKDILLSLDTDNSHPTGLFSRNIKFQS